MVDFTNVIDLENADFLTHLNYVEYLSTLSEGLKLSCERDIKTQMTKCSKISKKIKLIDLTMRSIEMERDIIKDDDEYASVCVSWMPVKSYYAIYNMMLLLIFMMSKNENDLSRGHMPTINFIKSQLKTGELVFSKSEFNKVFEGVAIDSWRIPKWENLKIKSDYRIEQVIRKLFDYAKQQYKTQRRIKRLSKKDGRDFMVNTNISLFEFFYWYRIKANYRDLEFIGKGISNKQFKNFYMSYLKYLSNMYNALKDCANNMSEIRFGEKLIDNQRMSSSEKDMLK